MMSDKNEATRSGDLEVLNELQTKELLAKWIDARQENTRDKRPVTAGDLEFTGRMAGRRLQLFVEAKREIAGFTPLTMDDVEVIIAEMKNTDPHNVKVHTKDNGSFDEGPTWIGFRDTTITRRIDYSEPR